MQELQVDLPITNPPGLLPSGRQVVGSPPGVLVPPAANQPDLVDPTGASGSNYLSPWRWVPGFFESASVSGSVFHTLIQGDAVFSAAGLPIVYDPIAGRLRNQGGLGLSYSWAGDQTIDMFLRAVDKSSKATVVHAPRVTAFNGQRAHILSVTRMAYIRDVDVVAVGFVAAYDPIIGYLNHGVVLDVRPIVSHDRKYVTLEIRADYAELVLMRFMDIISAFLIPGQVNPGSPPQPGNPPPTTPNSAGGRLAVQLPYLVYQRISTTALIPDRGTLIIGGFRDLQYADHYSGVPFYETIPVLNFFFSKKGKKNEKRRLFILVTPEIVDVSERERSSFE
jgi:type II secretory pathway component GspD/PulD (secretin)